MEEQLKKLTRDRFFTRKSIGSFLKQLEDIKMLSIITSHWYDTITMNTFCSVVQDFIFTASYVKQNVQHYCVHVHQALEYT